MWVYLALHRIEFSLFTTAELYLVSVPLVRVLRRTDVIRYAALWCPDFPSRKNSETTRRFTRFSLIAVSKDTNTFQESQILKKYFEN